MSGTGRVGVGVIGAGMISDTYLENLTSFPDVEVLAIGDLDAARAAAQAEKWGVRSSGAADDVLANPDVEIVVNLTIPAVHAEVALATLDAGKHVWTEKPIAVDRASARAVLDRAAATGLRVGVAPDTVLGPGVQTARRAIARGDIGTPIAAQTVMQYIGPDLFHPNPEFLFSPGAGPLFDMGPYYLTALANVFGAYDSVSASGIRGRETRRVQVGDRAGVEFPVTVPTLVNAIMRFESGAGAQSVFSFDSHFPRMGYVEVTGTEGTMLIPDPNMFVGDVKITHAGDPMAEPEWRTLEPVGVEAGRGLGVLDMARSIRAGAPHIATGELGYHVLDTMISIDESISSGQTVRVASSIGEIPLIPEEWDPREATL